MLASLRKTLIESYVAPIAIALLLAWGLKYAIESLFPLVAGVVRYLVTAVLILDIPSSPFVSSKAAIYFLFSESFPSLLMAAVNIAAAWLASRWIYGHGPISSLRIVLAEPPRRTNVSSIEKGTGR